MAGSDRAGGTDQQALILYTNRSTTSFATLFFHRILAEKWGVLRHLPQVDVDIFIHAANDKCGIRLVSLCFRGIGESFRGVGEGRVSKNRLFFSPF
ncbi:hypothetical protein A6X21_16945 [Planctopirus hydrillae]|uniref:Uncharacterized protein n=1 Tax=Planctopirus hydrillae TaxID=1841610 RepID=A0A1C3EQG6_9PLAN|nr:hypothetical protein A6X21_16945 [Planctopirus hydrillae]